MVFSSGCPVLYHIWDKMTNVNISHASLTRKTLKAALERRGLVSRVLMPEDGEAYVF